MTAGETAARPPLLVRVYGDSLGMPRWSDGVAWTATYPEVLAEELEQRHPGWRVRLYNRSRGGASIEVLRRDYDDDTSYFGDEAGGVLVLQCGIVDCAPRPLPPRARRLLGRLPGPVRAPIVGLLHRHRATLQRRGFAWTVTPRDVFRRVYGEWLAHAAVRVSRVLVLNIAPTTDAMDAHSPGLAAAIAEYNALIADVVREVGARNVTLVDVYAVCRCAPDAAELINQRDGHHITPRGHALFAQLLLRALTMDGEGTRPLSPPLSLAGEIGTAPHRPHR